MQTRKVIALVLAFVGPPGIGQFVLGRRTRGIAWLVGTMAFVFACGLAFPRLGGALGWTTATASGCVAMLVLWAASVGDLHFFTRERDATPFWQIALFVIAGLALPLVVSFAIRAITLESFVIPTPSMEPTVLAGDRIFADKRDRSPRYGEVIVFQSPEHPEQLLVKRVMALPGDVLEIRSARPFVNGWSVPSCPLGTVTLAGTTGALEVEFLGDASYLVFYDATPIAAHAGPLYAAKDAVLVLGDNRNQSADSRAWFMGRDGNVHASAHRGRALFVWMRASTEDDATYGIDLSKPILPSSLRAVRPALEKCLASRPNATPPRSLSP